MLRIAVKTVPALVLEDGPDVPALWCAANLAGAVWVPLNTELIGSFLEYQLKHCDLAVVVVDPAYADRVHPDLNALPGYAWWSVSGVSRACSSGRVASRRRTTVVPRSARIRAGTGIRLRGVLMGADHAGVDSDRPLRTLDHVGVAAELVRIATQVRSADQRR